MQVDIQQKPKTFVVVNPVAGRQEAETIREKIKAALQEHDIPFEFFETSPESNVPQTVQEAVKKGFKLLMAAGGDGTLAGVVSGLVDTHVPLVVLPTGTWNALARHLDIPLQVDQALALLFQEHRIKTVDAMQVGENYYLLNISTGLSSRILVNIKREEKRRVGKLHELWEGFAQLMQFPSFRFDVKIDGTLTTFHATEMMVANIRSIALKPLQLDTEIHMDDGKLNVCRIYAKSLRDYLRLIISMITGNQDRNWNVLCMEASKEVEIRSHRKLRVQGDGDIIGYLPITIRIRPKAVAIVTPVGAKP